MKIWVDDTRPAPKGYVLCRSVNESKRIIQTIENQAIHLAESSLECEAEKFIIKLIDLDHDAGDFAHDGGDYINLLNWLEETGRNYPIRLHSMNPVGRENMRRIIRRNGWKEVF